jgi:uncharacterized pyridoxal phosphate-containing UPF0001 family protein
VVGVGWVVLGVVQGIKVKALELLGLLHSLVCAGLADSVSAHGDKRGRPVDVLIQVNVAGEETKGGFPLAELRAEADRLKGLSGLRVRGVMTMAPFTDDERVQRHSFAGARSAREVLVGAGHPATELSMGMSNDFEVAVEEGATMVRLGTVLFGARSTQGATVPT